MRRSSLTAPTRELAALFTMAILNDLETTMGMILKIRQARDGSLFSSVGGTRFRVWPS